jgi:hypothetical protein
VRIVAAPAVVGPLIGLELTGGLLPGLAPLNGIGGSLRPEASLGACVDERV